MATARAERAKTSDQNGGHSGRLLLRMPPALHSELARAAESDGSSLNAFITRALSDTVAGSSRSAKPSDGRLLRVALIADLVLVAIAAIATVALLLVAWL